MPMTLGRGRAHRATKAAARNVSKVYQMRRTIPPCDPPEWPSLNGDDVRARRIWHHARRPEWRSHRAGLIGTTLCTEMGMTQRRPAQATCVPAAARSRRTCSLVSAGGRTTRGSGWSRLGTGALANFAASRATTNLTLSVSTCACHARGACYPRWVCTAARRDVVSSIWMDSFRRQARRLEKLYSREQMYASRLASRGVWRVAHAPCTDCTYHEPKCEQSRSVNDLGASRARIGVGLSARASRAARRRGRRDANDGGRHETVSLGRSDSGGFI